MCCGVKTPKPSGLSLPDCALAALHSAAYQGGKPRFIKIKKKILLLAALTRQRVGQSDDCEFTLLRTLAGVRSSDCDRAFSCTWQAGRWNCQLWAVWFACGPSLKLDVSNLRTFAVSFSSPTFSLTRAGRVVDWFLGHLFGALSDLQASQCCPQITV